MLYYTILYYTILYYTILYIVHMSTPAGAGRRQSAAGLAGARGLATTAACSLSLSLSLYIYIYTYKIDR